MPYPSAEGTIVNRISIGVVSVAGLSGGHTDITATCIRLIADKLVNSLTKTTSEIFISARR